MKFRQDINEFELLRVGYDTIELSNIYLDLSEELYSVFDEVKKQATDTEVLFDLSDSAIDFFMYPKSYGFYKFTISDKEKYFQISFNRTRCSVKIISTAFYILEIDTILEKLDICINELLGLSVYDFNISRMDIATDYKSSIRVLDRISKDDFMNNYGLKSAQYYKDNSCTGFEFVSNNLVLRVYDKLNELILSSELKKTVFYQLFGIESELDALLKSVSSDYQIMRIEYQLRRDIFDVYKLQVFNLKDFELIKSVFAYYVENHTCLEGYNEFYKQMLLDSYGVQANYHERIKDDKELEYLQKLYHLQKHLRAYLSSYHALKESRNGNLLNLGSITTSLYYMFKDEELYEETLEKKRKKAGLIKIK